MKATDSVQTKPGVLKKLRQGLDLWTAETAVAVQDLLARFRPSDTASLVESAENLFTIPGRKDGPSTGTECPLDQLKARLSGLPKTSFLDVELRSERFIFREIEVPAGASDVMSGLVRAQVEKLMPWKIDSMIYGWIKRERDASQKLDVLIAGCAFDSIRLLIAAFASCDVRRFSLFVRAPGGQQRIELWNEQVSPSAPPEPLHTRLKLGLVVMACVAVVSIAANSGLSFVFQTDGLVDAITQARQRLADTGIVATAARDPLVYKRSGPAMVLILEDLASLLPDGSYVTELRVDEGKVWISGKTKDPASLLLLFGQSGRFSAAKFFAPTTRNEEDGSDTFHIEAVVKPRSELPA